MTGAAPFPSCSVKFRCATFARQLRAHERKHPNLRQLCEEVLAQIVKDPLNAERFPVIGASGGCRKARVPTDGGGKSGGFRLIYYVMGKDPRSVVPIALYPKNELASMSGQAIAALLRDVV